MASRLEQLQKLLGAKQAAAATEAVEKLDAALEDAGIEHKDLDAAKMDADAFASAIVDVMKSDLSEDDKRATVIEAIKELMPTDHLSDADKKMDKLEHKTDEDMPDDEDDEDEDDDEEKTGKGFEIVAKMIDDIAVVSEAQLEIESQFKALEDRFATFVELAQRLDNLEKTVTKALRATPKMASRAKETIVEGDTSEMEKELQDYEIDPIFGRVKKGV